MPIVDAVGRTSGNAQVLAVNQVENQIMLTMEYRRESQGGQNTGVKFLIYVCVCILGLLLNYPNPLSP